MHALEHLLLTLEHYLLDIMTMVYQAIGWPGVVVMMAVESAAIPFPSELIMPLAGWLLIQAEGRSAWYLLLAGFYGALGNLLGSWLAYGISLKGGRPLLLKYGKYVLITREEVERAEAWFSRYGEWAVFLARLLPVVRTFISVPAGLARMDLWKFSVYTFAGSFPWSLGLAYGGYLLGENWEQLRAAMRPFDLPVLLVLGGAAGWFLWRRIRAIRAQSRAACQQHAGRQSIDDD